MAQKKPPKQAVGVASVKKRNNTPVFIGAGVVIVALLALAFLSTKPWEDDSKSTPEERSEVPYQSVTVEGTNLPKAPESGADSAIGAVAPNLVGKTFTGETVEVKPGKPKAVLFLAHWCPHCQAELPKLTEWINANKSKYDVDFVAIATATTPSRPNFPPAPWFKKEGYTLPVMADDSNYKAANAYGLVSYPYLVFLDGQNKLVSRYSGEAPITQFETAVKQISDTAKGTTTTTAPAQSTTSTTGPSSPAQ